jgi:hypothetical protein
MVDIHKYTFSIADLLLISKKQKEVFEVRPSISDHKAAKIDPTLRAFGRLSNLDS